jgi:hypothetical protein
MNGLGRWQAMAAEPVPRDERRTCEHCGKGKLDLVDERPDPIFGLLGMTISTFKCSAPECGTFTII